MSSEDPDVDEAEQEYEEPEIEEDLIVESWPNSQTEEVTI